MGKKAERPSESRMPTVCLSSGISNAGVETMSVLNSRRSVPVLLCPREFYALTEPFRFLETIVFFYTCHWTRCCLCFLLTVQETHEFTMMHIPLFNLEQFSNDCRK